MKQLIVCLGISEICLFEYLKPMARPKGFCDKIKYIICWIKAFAIRPPDMSASHKRRGPAERSNEDDDDDDDADGDDDDGDDIFVLLNRPHPLP